MKKIPFLIALLFAVLIIGCSKTTVEPKDNGNEFKFISLVSQDTALPVNGITGITANATGTGLIYQWTASYGSFIGSGPNVQWTVCHADTFTISCEVKDDKGHSETKVLSIHVQ